MTLTSLLNGAAQATGNRIPPMFQSIGVIGIRKIRKQDTLRTVQQREHLLHDPKVQKQNKEQRTVGIRAVRLVSLAA